MAGDAAPKVDGFPRRAKSPPQGRIIRCRNLNVSVQATQIGALSRSRIRSEAGKPKSVTAFDGIFDGVGSANWRL